MTPIHIKKGLDIPMDGAPASEVRECPTVSSVAVYQEIDGLKARLQVKEGDTVECGSALFVDKKLPALSFCAPAAGTVRSIEYGPRRALLRIVIDCAGDAARSFERYEAAALRGLDRQLVIDQLLASGLWALIQQRPFSRVADPAVTPKSIFVNGMNTAPFTPALHVAVQAGGADAFQAGLHLMTRLTEGAVHLCVGPSAPDEETAVTAGDRVEIHRFTGPHPAGNTSVHIHHIDPMQPTDQVWTVKAVDVIRMGRLFLTGRYPADKLVTLAGPGVKAQDRCYYRLPVGTPLSQLLDGRLEPGEQRVLNGDVLAGTTLRSDGHVPFSGGALTVLPEGREQFFMGWMAPGINKLSASKAYLSGWTGHRRKWNLTTSLNGSRRSMVLTGLYDQYQPLNIMVDYLARAVLAHDTDEAIQLGILETDPEDFALCAYVCPSKMDLCGVIRQGLNEIEQEGI